MTCGHVAHLSFLLALPQLGSMVIKRNWDYPKRIFFQETKKEPLTLHILLSCPWHFSLWTSQCPCHSSMIYLQPVSSEHCLPQNLHLQVFHRLQPGNHSSRKGSYQAFAAMTLAILLLELLGQQAVCACMLPKVHSCKSKGCVSKAEKYFVVLKTYPPQRTKIPCSICSIRFLA